MTVLASAISGPDDAPPLVFVGSLGTHKAMWRPQLHAFQHRHRLIALDARGHGESPVPPGPYTIAELAADVLETLDALGVDRFHYCGLSIGGMIGQWLGAHAPDRIDHLILLFTAAVAPDPSVFAGRAQAVREAGSAAHLIPGLLPRWLTEGYRSAHPDDVTFLSDMVAACPAEGYAACAEAIAAMDLRPSNPTITAPTLVVGGAQDLSLPPDYARAVADAIPYAHFELLDPCGHLGNIEQADAVNELIVAHMM